MLVLNTYNTKNILPIGKMYVKAEKQLELLEKILVHRLPSYDAEVKKLLPSSLCCFLFSSSSFKYWKQLIHNEVGCGTVRGACECSIWLIIDSLQTNDQNLYTKNRYCLLHSTFFLLLSTQCPHYPQGNLASLITGGNLLHAASSGATKDFILFLFT